MPLQPGCAHSSQPLIAVKETYDGTERLNLWAVISEKSFHQNKSSEQNIFCDSSTLRRMKAQIYKIRNRKRWVEFLMFEFLKSVSDENDVL